MKKNIILMFGFLLFAQGNIFAMDCCVKKDGHSGHSDLEHQKMAKDDHGKHSDSEHKEMKTTGKDIVVNRAKMAEDAGNAKCPVSGEKINEKYKATYEYKGKIYNFCCAGCIDEFKKDPEKFIKKVEEENKKKGGKINMKVKDPICSMEINSEDAAATSVFNDKTYYFCSKDCKKKFDKEPKKYIKE